MSTVDESLGKIVVLESSSDFNCMKGFLGDIGSAFNAVVLSGPELFFFSGDSIFEPRREVSCSGAL